MWAFTVTYHEQQCAGPMAWLRSDDLEEPTEESTKNHTLFMQIVIIDVYTIEVCMNEVCMMRYMFPVSSECE